MTVHVLPGDALAAEFKKAKIEGDVIVCRECLVVGPVDAGSPSEFWDQRAAFILSEYGEDEIVYHETVASELERLTDVEPGIEVNLWFEYELFCSINLWFSISLLNNSGAKVYRVEPSVLNATDRWKGFGELDAAKLAKCLEDRKEFGTEDLKLGADLWQAFRNADHRALKRLSTSSSPLFPYLAEVCEAAIEASVRPIKVLREIRKEGISEFGDLFAEFQKRAGVYGYGDLQVQRLLDRLAK